MMYRKRRYGRSTLEVALLIPIVLFIVISMVDMAIYLFLLNDSEIVLDKIGAEIVAKVNAMTGLERAVSLFNQGWLVEELESRFSSRQGVQLIKPMYIAINSNGINSMLILSCQYVIVTPLSAVVRNIIPSARVVNKERTWIVNQTFQTLKTAKLFGYTFNQVDDIQSLIQKLEWGYVTIIRFLGS